VATPLAPAADAFTALLAAFGAGFAAALGAAFGAAFTAALGAVFADVFGAPLAAVLGVALRAVFGAAFGAVLAVAFDVVLAAAFAAGFFVDDEAVARAPALGEILVDSFEDTLRVAFFDAGCRTDFATFASLSGIRGAAPGKRVAHHANRDAARAGRRPGPVNERSGARAVVRATTRPVSAERDRR